MKSAIAILLSAASLAAAANSASTQCSYSCPQIPFTGAVPANLVGDSHKGTVVECNYLAIDGQRFNCDYDTVTGAQTFAGVATCPKVGADHGCTQKPHGAHPHKTRTKTAGASCTYTCPHSVNGAQNVGNYYDGNTVECYCRRTDQSIFKCGYDKTNGSLVSQDADDCATEPKGYGINCPISPPPQAAPAQKRHMEPEYFN